MHFGQLCCTGCNKDTLVKNGFYALRGERYQAYRCRSCGRSFSDRSEARFARYRQEDWVLILALQLVRLGLSGPAVSEVLRKQFHIRVSRWTIARWAAAFGSGLLRQHAVTPTEVWHADELFIHAKKTWWYVFAVIDSANRCLALTVSLRRSSRAARACFRRAARFGRPAVLVTDGWNGYPRAVRSVFGRRATHVVAHFAAERVVANGRWYSLSNNRIEGWNSRLRPLLRRMRGPESLPALEGRLETYQVLGNLGEAGWEFLAQ